jgi:hypothetical protein
MASQIPSPSQPLVRADGVVTVSWFQFFMRLLASVPSGGAAPADADYILGGADADLPNGRVVTDSPSIDFDLGTAGQLKAHVIVDVAGALDGGTLADLKVRVDGTTIQINGSNQLEAIGGGGLVCSPLTDGDLTQPELIFALGDVIMVCA